MNSFHSTYGSYVVALKPHGWRLFLAMLLVLGQVLLLNHVIVHQLEDAITPNNDHCSFCAIGNHSAPAVVAPPTTPSLAYTLVLYLAFGCVYVTGFSLSQIRLRGPPFSLG